MVGCARHLLLVATSRSVFIVVFTLHKALLKIRSIVQFEFPLHTYFNAHFACDLRPAQLGECLRRKKRQCDWQGQ